MQTNINKDNNITNQTISNRKLDCSKSTSNRRVRKDKFACICNYTRANIQKREKLIQKLGCRRYNLTKVVDLRTTLLERFIILRRASSSQLDRQQNYREKTYIVVLLNSYIYTIGRTIFDQ